MKNFLLLLTVLGAIVFTNSCVSDDLENQKQERVQSDIVIDEVIHAVLIDDVLKEVDFYSLFGEGFLKSAEVVDGDCPVITVEKMKEGQEWPRKVTIDYGDGCEKNGKKMTGKMIIVKTGPLHLPGSVREVSFREFVAGGVSITGNKRFKNITEREGAPTFNINIDIKQTFYEGDKVIQTVRRKEEKKQVWIEGFGKRDVPAKFVVSGASSVIIIKGDREKIIDKKEHRLLIVAGCRFPQEGVAEMMVRNFDGEKLAFALDYSATGAGVNCQNDCDCTATLIKDKTQVDVDLSKRRDK